MYAIEDVNRMSHGEFVQTIGTVFEHSPWVAEKSWKHHPFHGLEHMHSLMVHEMNEADITLQLSLLRAHPDLGTKLAVSEASKQEQESAGLSSLTEAEYEEFSRLNKSYVENFGFPFIMAVKGQGKDQILEAMKQRRYHSYENELQTALQEVGKIAKFRLTDMIFEEEVNQNL